MKNFALIFGLFTLLFSTSVSALELSNSNRQKDIQQAIEMRKALHLKKMQKRALRKKLGFEAILLERNAKIQRRSTRIKRTGALQKNHKNRFFSGGKNRMNTKQSFRKRAENYYIQNGDGKISDLVKNYGETYRNRSSVNRLPNYLQKNNKSLARIKANLRRQNRRLRTLKTVPTGYQKTTYRRGDASRNYFSPFLKNTQTQ